MTEIAPVAELHHAALRRWARGRYNLEAATELLIRAFGGRYASPNRPWILVEAVGAWIDFEMIPEQTGGLSGGEHRFLMTVASIGGGVPVSLEEVLSGQDRKNVDLLLAAIAHASGSHESSDFVHNEDGTASIVRHTTLYPWPRA